MPESDIAQKAVSATKWSLVTQVASKLITPITTLVLAHLLAPEVFGVVALVTMVTSFADLFADAGFQKYLIQHEYDSEGRYRLSCDVAFWTNATISFMLWGLIALLSDFLAAMLGDSSIGPAIVVACASLPLTSAVSVQTAVYQRAFDFKTLFYSRVGSSLLILFVSVTLALLGWGYWSMIAGTVASNLLLAVWLTLKSDWKPSFRYSVAELKAMLSFSAWTLVEQLSIWLTNWIGAFILGTFMGAYYLGLYNTSVTLVNSVVAIVAGAVNPVVFASLSRMQGDRERFDGAFYSMQKYLGIAVVPIAVALFVYSDAVVGLYLGNQWIEASLFLGLYSLTSAFVVVFGHICSDAYRAMGKPKYSLIAQIGFLAFLILGLLVGACGGFGILSVSVPVARLAGCLVTHFLICKLLMGLSPLRMLWNMRWIYLIALIVGGLSYAAVHMLGLGYWPQCAMFFISIAGYLALCFVFKDTRLVLIELCEKFGTRMPKAKA